MRYVVKVRSEKHQRAGFTHMLVDTKTVTVIQYGDPSALNLRARQMNGVKSKIGRAQ